MAKGWPSLVVPLLVTLPAYHSVMVTVADEDPLCNCLDWSSVYLHKTGSGSPHLDCMQGLGGLEGQEFCGFIKRFKSNMCLLPKFQEPTIEEEPVCFVSPQCNASNSESIERLGVSFVKVKHCKQGVDKIAMNESPGELGNVGKSLGVDAGVLAGYSSTCWNKLVADLTDDEVARIKASGIPTLIWSMQDHFADRWYIKGPQVWVHRFRPDYPGYWEVHCKEGCQ